MAMIADSSIDNFHFKLGDYGDECWSEISPKFGATGSRLKSAAFEAAELARSARDFFTGWFPRTAYFADQLIALPWCDEYGNADAIAAAVRRVAGELGRVDPSECPRTYDSEILCASDKTVLQGLAVETMLLADGCINLLVEAKVVAALPWLCAAYQRIIDCSRQAQAIVESPYA